MNARLLSSAKAETISPAVGGALVYQQYDPIVESSEPESFGDHQDWDNTPLPVPPNQACYMRSMRLSAESAQGGKDSTEPVWGRPHDSQQSRLQLPSGVKGVMLTTSCVYRLS